MEDKRRVTLSDRHVRRALLAGAALVAPLALLAVVQARPDIDEQWESHPAHFWLVLAAALVSVALGYAISVAARRRRDARLFLVSLAFVASAGFLGLHALATPGVLLGKNAGFELATPVGLVLAGGFAAASSLELPPRAAERVLRASGALLAGLFALIGAWAAVSLAELPPLADALAEEELDGWQLALAAAGIALYAVAALGYLRLYRRRRARFVLAVALAFALLAEAMVVIAWARNWRVSWWEWHVLMLASFLVIAQTARSEWHEERFSDLYLDRTLAGARDVSILLADLSGFTAFSERRDPGEVAEMLNAYFEAVVPLLEADGAEVHQIVGDEVMAVFNKEGDTPDHPQRAARAALRLQEAAARVAAAHPGWPRFRAGVNSGEALAGIVGGSRGHRKHGVVGDTVNLAARLEAVAEPGAVVIGEATYRRLDPGALAERLPPLTVKGKSEPVEAYVLHRVGSRTAMSDDAHPREDDRNEEVEGSPVPDPTEEQGDAADVPEAD
jgi:class 3 adenylate cyclase